MTLEMKYRAVILVHGHAGVGKSSFLNQLIGEDRFTCADGEKHCTLETKEVVSKNILFVDGPGSDLDSNNSAGPSNYRGEKVYIIVLGFKPRKNCYVEKTAERYGIGKEYIHFFFQEEAKTLTLDDVMNEKFYKNANMNDYVEPRKAKKKNANRNEKKEAVFLPRFRELELLENDGRKTLDLTKAGPQYVPNIKEVQTYRQFGDALIKLKSEQMVLEGIIKRDYVAKLQSNAHMSKFISKHPEFEQHAKKIYENEGSNIDISDEKKADVLEALIGKLFFGNKRKRNKAKKLHRTLLTQYFQSYKM